MDQPRFDAGEPPSPPRAASSSDRLQEIVTTAERVAEEIRAEVEAAAAAQIEERRQEADRAVDATLRVLDSIWRSVSAQSASVQREAAALADEIDDAMRRLRLLTDRDVPPDASEAVGPAAPPSRIRD
jgi:aspartate oxidase